MHKTLSSARLRRAWLILPALAACAAPGPGSPEREERAQPVLYDADSLAPIVLEGDAPPVIAACIAQTVAISRSRDLSVDERGQTWLRTRPLSEAAGLCRDERMADWPSGAVCSGVWLAPGLVATARHCVRDVPCSELRVVTGFVFRDDYAGADSQPVTAAWACRATISADALDLALVQLQGGGDGVPAPKLRSASTVKETETALLVGHPLGAPATMDTEVVVAPSSLFPQELRAAADAFEGHSGAPIFDRAGRLLGLLVGGARDLTFDPEEGCLRPIVLTGAGRERVQPLHLLHAELCMDPSLPACRAWPLSTDDPVEELPHDEAPPSPNDGDAPRSAVAPRSSPSSGCSIGQPAASAHRFSLLALVGLLCLRRARKRSGAGDRRKPAGDGAPGHCRERVA